MTREKDSVEPISALEESGREFFTTRQTRLPRSSNVMKKKNPKRVVERPTGEAIERLSNCISALECDPTASKEVTTLKVVRDYLIWKRNAPHLL